MDKENGLWQKLKKNFTKNGEGDKKYPFLLVALLIGGAVLISGNSLFNQDSKSSTPVSSSSEQAPADIEAFGKNSSSGNQLITEYENRYETVLKEALEGITGVSDVKVVVNVDATEKKVLEKNSVIRSQKTEEKDREGGERVVEDQSRDNQLVIIRDGEKEVPILLETKKPEIRGVLIVAKGADNIQVKKWIIESVTKLLDVPSHRVSVMPKK